jgi:hypothetical protein
MSVTLDEEEMALLKAVRRTLGATVNAQIDIAAREYITK